MVLPSKRLKSVFLMRVSLRKVIFSQHRREEYVKKYTSTRVKIWEPMNNWEFMNIRGNGCALIRFM